MKFKEVVYQCDGFMAIKHAMNTKTSKKTAAQTKCGIKPTQGQWDLSSISYEHNISSCQYECQICYPAFKDKVHT